MKDFAVEAAKRQVEEVSNQLLIKFKSEEKIIKIIQQLHRRYILQGPQKENIKSDNRREQDHQGKLFNEQQLNNMVTQIVNDKQNEQATFVIQTVPYPHTFANEIEEVEFYEKKIASQVFIRWGYSYHVFIDEIRKRGGFFDISENRYKKIANTFIIDVFKRIEMFLQVNCAYNKKRSFKLKGMEIYSILFNCRKYFDRTEIITLFKFIALLFQDQCSYIQVRSSDVICFYERAIKLMRERLQKHQAILLNPQRVVISRRASRQVSLRVSKYSQHLTTEEQLVELYIQYPKVNETKEHFYQMYGHCQEYNSSRAVQSVIFKWIRKGIKNLQNYYGQHFLVLPKLAQIDDGCIRKILTNLQAALLRVRILKFTRIRELNINIIGDLIKHINQFIFSLQNEEAKQDIESQHSNNQQQFKDNI